MALQHLRSSTADKRPTPAAMAEGQLALNSAAVSPGLFFKNASGALVKVGPVHVGTTAPNATPASGGEAGNSVGEQWLDTSGTNPVLKIWDGSGWASEAGEFVNASGDTMTGALVMDNQQQVRFRETTANGTNYIAIQAPASVAADRTLTLPDVDGTLVSSGDTGTVTSTMILDGTIVNADINASAAIVDTKLDTIATAGKVSNSATTATNANTASAIVARDGSGNFSAGTITAALTGAASANVLKAGDTMTGVLAVTAGTAALPAITPSGDPNTGIYSPGADQLAISTNATGRLFVNADGNVTINSTVNSVPSTYGDLIVARPVFNETPRLVLVGDNNLGSIRFGRRDTLSSFSTSYAAIDGIYGSGDARRTILAFSTSDTGASTERMRITSDGKVGLGTSSPGSLLNLSTSSTGTSTESLRIDGGERSSASFAAGFRVYTESTGNNSNRHLRIICNGNTGFSIQPYETSTGNAATDKNIFLCPSGGRVGIGTTSPSAPLAIFTGGISAGSTASVLSAEGGTGSINTSLRVDVTPNSPSGLVSLVSTTGGTANTSAMNFVTRISGTEGERMRIDGSGRVLIGTSSAQGNSLIQVQGDASASNATADLLLWRNNAPFGFIAGTVGTRINLGASPSSGIFGLGARIEMQGDGTWGSGDYPGRLVFFTTAAGASSPTERFRITNAGVLQVADAGNISVGTTTGTKIGTATTQKLGFYNATPVVQPTAVADATDAASVITQLNALLTRMRNLGLIAT